MAYETIVVETEDHVCLVRLNRPDALNALNDVLLGELVDALQAAQANDKVRCIVITGSEKAFAAGADIKMMSSKSFVDAFAGDLFGSEHDEIMRIRKPIIAAVSGYALGGGCELAMMCDFIIASDTAKFGQPEINLGVIAGLGDHLGGLIERFAADIIEWGGFHRVPPIQPRMRAMMPSGCGASPALRPRAAKNWPMTIFAAPSSSRPPTDATLPPTAAS